MKRFLLLFFALGMLTSTSIQAMEMEDYATGDETSASGDDGNCPGLHGDEDDTNGPHGDE